MNTPALLMVYVPCPDEATAERIAQTIVSERLAACANILKGGHSFYWWEGQVQKDPETFLILKTRPELYSALARRVEELHPYSVPAILAIPVVQVNQAYLDWAYRETQPADDAAD